MLFLVCIDTLQSPVDRESPFRFLGAAEDDVDGESIK